MKRYSLNPISKSRSSLIKIYNKLRIPFLESNPVCQICNDHPSTQVHHKKGKLGLLLIAVEYWMACCFTCHRKIEDNRAWGYQMGFLLDRLSKDS